MSKSILIPTDFSVKSLGLVRLAVEDTREQQISIVLGHGYALGSSISELLFYSRLDLLDSLMPEEFYSAIQILKSTYGSRLAKLRVEFFHGHNQAAFHSYADAHGITDAYVASSDTFQCSHKRSFDLLPYIQKSDLRVHEVAPSQVLAHVPGRSLGTVADLFFTS